MIHKKPPVLTFYYIHQNWYKLVKKLMSSTHKLFLLEQKENLQYNNFSERFLEHKLELGKISFGIEDGQQNCLVDKTNRTNKNSFLITKCKFLDMLITFYIVQKS